MPVLGSRLVVAGVSSGVGKTTVATGLLAALQRSGGAAAGAKVGPDFIDPGYHSLASGRPPRNLDAWMCGPEAIGPLAARAGSGADVLIVEGVMGLFDGAVDGAPSSTADVARLLQAPVVLVVDASAMSASVAALVHGYRTYDPTVRVAGVIFNQVSSDGHEVLLREALVGSGVEVLGALRRDDNLIWRDRHLGLVPVAEDPASVSQPLDRLAHLVAEQVDLEAVMALARSAPPLITGTVALPPPGPPVTIGVAGGAAFTFTYTDTLDALEAAGARIVIVNPLHDDALPTGGDVLDGLIIGGGFPEVHAAALSGNGKFLRSLGDAVKCGLPTWAECGGLLLLCQDLDGHPMAGVVPARATMTSKLSLGYRQVTTTIETPIGPAGARFRGHEFHYSQVEPAGDALLLESRFGTRRDGWGGPDLVATYAHHHPGGQVAPITAFLRSCALYHALRARKPPKT